jgi:HlyD family secretion protein
MVNNKRSKKNRTILILLAAVVLLVAGGVSYYFWNQKQTIPKISGSATAAVKTALAKTGNIILSATGTGKVVSNQQTSLSFPISGTVKDVKVQVGDKVTKGQVLAELQDLSTLQAKVSTAQQDLISAQQALTVFHQNAAANLANAQLALTDAEKAVTDAQSALIQPGTPRCDTATTTAYYDTYLRLQNELTKLGDGGGNQNYYLFTIVPVKNRVARAYQAYLNCAGYTAYEISYSKATLSLKQAQLKQAQDTLDTLQKNNGEDPIALAQAQNKVFTAQIALDTAQQNLDGAVINAPFDGTIMTVNGQAGDNIGTSTFITIADLAHPQIQFYVDENDMDKVAVNEPVQVSFDAIPNVTFDGKVIQIDPTLATVSGYQALKGLAQLDLTNQKQAYTFPIGMSAAIDVVGGKAENVIIVPVDALRDMGNGEYAVFVIQNGQPRLRTVEVGLMDAVNAEIKSGVQSGEIVSTGTIGTK